MQPRELNTRQADPIHRTHDPETLPLVTAASPLANHRACHFTILQLPRTQVITMLSSSDAQVTQSRGDKGVP